MAQITINEFRKLIESGQTTFENLIVNPDTTSAHGYYDKDDTIVFSEAFTAKELKNFSIVNCEFNVNLFFLKIDFIELSEPHFLKNVIFNEDVLFNSVNFKIICSVEDCTFNKKVKFVSCEFFGKTDFISVTFNSDLLFEKEDISNIEYRKYDFDSKYLSPPIESEETIELEYFQKGYNTFHECTKFLCSFNGRTVFTYVTFLSVDFSRSFFANQFTEFKFVVFKNLGLFRYLILEKNITFITCDLTNCSFLFSKFDDANFISCYFDLQYLIDRRMSNPLDFPREEIYCFGINEGHSILSFSKMDIINAYRMFEINFDKHKDVDIAGNFHVMRYELLKKYYMDVIQNNFTKYNIKNYLKRIIKSAKKDRDDFENTTVWKRFRYKLGLNDLFKKESYFEKTLFGKTKFRIWKLTKYNLTLTFKIFFLYLYKISSNYGESYLRSLFWIFACIFLIFPSLYMYSGIYFASNRNIYDNEVTANSIEVLIQYYPYNEASRYDLINDYGCSLMQSLNGSFPFKKGFGNVRSANFVTTSISFFQTTTLPILVTLFIIGIRRKFKR